MLFIRIRAPATAREWQSTGRPWTAPSSGEPRRCGRRPASGHADGDCGQPTAAGGAQLSAAVRRNENLFADQLLAYRPELPAEAFCVVHADGHRCRGTIRYGPRWAVARTVHRQRWCSPLGTRCARRGGMRVLSVESYRSPGGSPCGPGGIVGLDSGLEQSAETTDDRGRTPGLSVSASGFPRCIAEPPRGVR